MDYEDRNERHNIRQRTNEIVQFLDESIPTRKRSR